MAAAVAPATAAPELYAMSVTHQRLLKVDHETAVVSLDGDGNVGINDFRELLADWGPCR